MQETFARAWRARARFRREGRWSFRAWLYRVATNACLDHVARRRPRVLPVDVAPAAEPRRDLSADRCRCAVARAVSRSPGGPARGRRRARDPRDCVRGGDPAPAAAPAGDADPARRRGFLGARDGEAAGHERAGASTAAAAGPRRACASGCHRGATSGRARPRPRSSGRSRGATSRRSSAGTSQRSAALVREDARFSFPPRPLWYDGLDAFRRASEKHAAPGEHLFVAARANLQPAVAIYLRSPGAARYRPLALAVLRVEGGARRRGHRLEPAGAVRGVRPADEFSAVATVPTRTRSTRRRSDEGRDGAGVAGGAQGAAGRRAGAGAARQARRGAAARAAVGPGREGVQVRDRGRAEAAARAVRGALAAAHLPPDVRGGLGGCVPGLLVARRRAGRRGGAPQ